MHTTLTFLPCPLPYLRCTLAGDGAAAPGGGNRGGGIGGILGWVARQFVNQAKAVPLLRWPQFGFFSARTWINTIVDSTIVLLCLGVFVVILGVADQLAIIFFRAIQRV